MIYFSNAICADVQDLCLVDQVDQRYDDLAGDDRNRYLISIGVRLWQIYRSWN